MVFYQTSTNIKLMRNVNLDYEQFPETTPYEYIEEYITNCPEEVEDAKLKWIAETFLGVQKHKNFFRNIASHLPDEVTVEDQDYIMIVLYSIVFQLEPKAMPMLYKSLFNLNKSLLGTLTKFLSNNEVLTYISHVAQVYFDSSYVTEKIIAPLFIWQPYISEMAHDYADYLRKVESRKIKLPTIPIQPTVLNRKAKSPVRMPSQPSQTSPVTPPNSTLNKDKKMLSKTTIDRKLKIQHEKNKQRAENLLNAIKNSEFHYAETKPADKKKLSYDCNDNEESFKPWRKNYKVMPKSSLPPVKENIATIKRMNKRVQMAEQEEVQWLQSLMDCCRNSTRVDELIQFERQEKEKERIYDIEKKHLMGQISHEEAILAKKKVEEHNKKKYEKFMKEKEQWDNSLETWKALQLKKSRLQIANISLLELNILKARNNITNKNKDIAEKLKKDVEDSISKEMQRRQEELDRKVKMIKEIHILALVAKKTKVPKIIDLTESSGVGLLCEMSIAELQERLAQIRMSIKDEIDKKKVLIKERNETAKKDLEEEKNCIKTYSVERAEIRHKSKLIPKAPVVLDSEPSKEINNLKKMLHKKRQKRLSIELR